MSNTIPYNGRMGDGPSFPRRGFLRKGLVGGALLLVAGAVGISVRRTRRGPAPRAPLALFTPDEHAVFAAVAARVAPGDGAGPAWPPASALDCAGKADALLARCHPAIGRDFKRLLRLFESGLFGLVLTGRPTPFSQLAGEAQDERLRAWERSRLPLLRSGYQAMVRLAAATYYSAPEVYALVGYPGPPSVALP